MQRSPRLAASLFAALLALLLAHGSEASAKRITQGPPPLMVPLSAPSPWVAAGSTESIQTTLSGCGAWTTLTPDVPPFFREQHAMVYDPVRDRLLTFGGSNNAVQPYDSDVWVTTLGSTPQHSKLVVAGAPPAGRISPSGIYDSVRDRVVVFGGRVSEDGYSLGPVANDVWVLTFSGTPTWTQLSPSGTPPPARYVHSAIYDAGQDRMIVFGGNDYDVLGTLNDVWALNFSGTPTWTQLSPTGTPPGVRENHSAVYDAPRNRMVVFGGYDPSLSPSELGDTWALSLTGSPAWTQISPSGTPPAPRYGHTAIADPPRNRMIVFAGAGTSSNLNDVWALSFTNPIRWTQLSPSGSTPPEMYYFASVYDAAQQRMVSVFHDQFWALTLSGSPAWSVLPVACLTPQSLFAPALIHDGPRQRYLVIGGEVNGVGPTRDVWTWNLSGGNCWTKLLPAGVAPARAYHSGTYDPVGDRVILIGGKWDESGNAYSNKVFSLSLSGTPTWTQITPSGTPPVGRILHSAILDAPRNRIIIYAGLAWNGSTETPLADVWALSLAGGMSWTQLNPSPPPPARSWHVAIFDAPRNRMVVHGGGLGSGTTTYAMNLVGAPVWTSLSTSGDFPSQSTVGIGAYDSIRERFLFANPEPWTTRALSLSGSLVWTTVGLTTPPPAQEPGFGQRATFDSANDRLVMAGGPTQGNLIRTLSFLSNAFTLSLAATPSAGGSVEANPAVDCFSAGSMTTVTATPVAGYVFSGWSGDASGSTNPLSVTMNANKSITANFSPITVTVSASPAGAGTVSKSPDLSVYPMGTQVTLTASNSPYPFQSWSGDASGSTNPLTITVDGSKNIVANFLAYTVTTTAQPGSGGSITRSPNQQLFSPGQELTLTAVPATGFSFDHWSGDASGAASQVTLTVDANKNAIAHFVAPPPACGQWSMVPTASLPSARQGAHAVWDPVRHRLLMFGGREGAGASRNDVWQLTMGATPAWTQLTPSGTPPGVRFSGAMVYDPVRDRLLLFGGLTQFPTVRYNDVWALSLTGTPTWTQLTPAGTPPVVRYGHVMIYDPIRDRLVVFGGWAFTGGPEGAPQNDLWELSLTGTPTWTLLAPAGPLPPTMFSHTAIYDPIRDRMVVVGGNGARVLTLAGTPTWSALSPAGTPHTTFGTKGIYDPVLDRMICVGGTISGTPVARSTVLTFQTLTLWSPQDRAGPSLGARDGHTAVYDPDERTVIVFGGWNGSAALNSTLRLDLGGGETIDAAATNGTIEVAYPCYSNGSVATVMAAPAQGYKLNQWIGSASGNSNPLQLTMNGYKVVGAEFVPATTGVESVPTFFELGNILPNPTTGASLIEYSVARQAHVRIAVFDIAGREVARLVDGSRSPGRYTVRWDGRVGGQRMAAGIYLVRFDSPAGPSTRRIALLN